MHETHSIRRRGLQALATWLVPLSLVPLSLVPLALLVPAAAHAQTVTLGMALAAREAPGVELGVDLRLRTDEGIQLGLLLDGGARDAAYLGGYAEHGAGTLGAGVVFLAPLVVHRGLSLDFRAIGGSSYFRLFDQAHDPASESVRARLEVAMLAHVRLSPEWLLRAGLLLGFDLEVTPQVDLADQSQLLTLGVGWAPVRELMLYASVDGGGTYGFDGDNGKVILRGVLGARMTFDGEALDAF